MANCKWLTIDITDITFIFFINRHTKFQQIVQNVVAKIVYEDLFYPHTGKSNLNPQSCHRRNGDIKLQDPWQKKMILNDKYLNKKYVNPYLGYY